MDNPNGLSVEQEHEVHDAMDAAIAHLRNLRNELSKPVWRYSTIVALMARLQAEMHIVTNGITAGQSYLGASGEVDRIMGFDSGHDEGEDDLSPEDRFMRDMLRQSKRRNRGE